jgi:hypothetical protein
MRPPVGRLVIFALGAIPIGFLAGFLAAKVQPWVGIVSAVVLMGVYQALVQPWAMGMGWWWKKK